MGSEVEDRVAHQLPGPVKGDVAAALDLDHLDPAARELLRRQRQTGRSGAAAQGHHRRVLDQQQDVVGQLARDALLPQDSLQLERFGVTHRAEIADIESSCHAEVIRLARRKSRRATRPASAAAASRAGVPSAASSRR